jgi:LmbE family N-acetylglucosaminyl deacetylase
MLDPLGYTGTVLGIWAHPDDDIYLSSGIMAAVARAGGRVIDVTATRGEGGSMDEERWPPATMGETRTRELLRSLEILGVREHRFLDGPVDLDMDSHLDPSGAGQVAAIVAEVQPDLVLTMGPDGMTGHVGHKDVSRWVTDAFEAEAKAGARLCYATYTQAWADRWVDRLNEFDIFRPGTPPITPEDELEICFRLPDDIRRLKVQALAAHESQTEGLVTVFGHDGLAEAMAEEYFRLGAVKA